MLDFEDPRKAALMMMAAGLLSPVRSKGASGFGEALSQGLRGGLLGFNEASQNKRRSEVMAQQAAMQKMQMEAMQRQAEEMQRQQAFRAAAFKPGVGAQPLTPNDDDGNPMPSPAVRFDPQAGAQVAPDLAYEVQQKMAKQAPKPMVVGKSLVNPETGQPIYREPEQAPDWQNPQYQDWRMKLAQAGRPPATQVTTNVLPPREVFKDSMALKKDFDGVPEVKGFKEVRSAWDQISTALSRPSAANDMAAATKFMKLLDPGSVVRESELMMAMQASGVLDRMANYHKRLMNGEKLTPTQREDFFQSGKALYDAAKGRYDETVNQYEGIAKQYGLDPSFIYRGKEKLTKNAAATAKAMQAIRAGAPRDQVVRRLIEEGFDPEGL